ncbi:MMPL family transporter [Streptomyces shenzhenensis]
MRGTGLSARVVTAAALIMFSVFVAFMFTKDPTIKTIGFSSAVGVFLDAFVVRLTLVPAVMAIVESRVWHHPRWFARHVPTPTSRAGTWRAGSPTAASRRPWRRLRRPRACACRNP